MKKPAVFWISLLVILAVFLSACGFGGLFSENVSDSVSSEPAAIDPQPVSTADEPVQAAQEPTGAPENSRMQIVLLGNPDPEDATAQAVRSVQAAGDYQVSVNAPIDSASLVLFFVDVANGPMPKTLSEIEKRIGESFPRAAILLTNIEQNDDPELQQLVVIEYRETLARYLPDGQANSWEVLSANSSDLPTQLESLLNTSEQPIALQQRTEAAQAPAVPAPPSSIKRIVLIGDRTDGEEVAPLIQAAGNYEVEVDGVVDPSDLVLFFVSAVDGPMINTKTEIDNRRGEPFPRGAFLLTKDDQNNDAELQALITQEYRDIMRSFLPNGEADSWPVLLSTDPNLAARLEELLNSPEQFTVIQ